MAVAMASQESEPKKPGLAREDIKDSIEIKRKRITYSAQIKVVYFEDPDCSGHTASWLQDEVSWGLSDDIPLEKIRGMKKDLELKADLMVRDFNGVLEVLRENFPEVKITVSDPLGEPEDC